MTTDEQEVSLTRIGEDVDIELMWRRVLAALEPALGSFDVRMQSVAFEHPLPTRSEAVRVSGNECGSFTDIIALPVRVLDAPCFLITHDPADGLVQRLTAGSTPAKADGVIAHLVGHPRPDIRLGASVTARIGA